MKVLIINLVILSVALTIPVNSNNEDNLMGSVFATQIELIDDDEAAVNNSDIPATSEVAVKQFVPNKNASPGFVSSSEAIKYKDWYIVSGYGGIYKVSRDLTRKEKIFHTEYDNGSLYSAGSIALFDGYIYYGSTRIDLETNEIIKNARSFGQFSDRYLLYNVSKEDEYIENRYTREKIYTKNLIRGIGKLIYKNLHNDKIYCVVQTREGNYLVDEVYVVDLEKKTETLVFTSTHGIASLIYEGDYMYYLTIMRTDDAIVNISELHRVNLNNPSEDTFISEGVLYAFCASGENAYYLKWDAEEKQTYWCAYENGKEKYLMKDDYYGKIKSYHELYMSRHGRAIEMSFAEDRIFCRRRNNRRVTTMALDGTDVVVLDL